jgi:hypothetical protein
MSRKKSAAAEQTAPEALEAGQPADESATSPTEQPPVPATPAQERQPGDEAPEQAQKTFAADPFSV